MVAPLAAMALQAGMPLIERILSGTLGDKDGKLATEVIGKIAATAGSNPATLGDFAAERPAAVIDAMRAAEKLIPDMVGAYAADLQLQMAALAAEQEGPLWVRAWRPMGMYLLGFLWLWNVAILHVCNAVWKIALPQMDLGALVQLSALYMGLYMGGHTVKDVVAKWTGQPGGQRGAGQPKAGQPKAGQPKAGQPRAGQ